MIITTIVVTGIVQIAIMQIVVQNIHTVKKFDFNFFIVKTKLTKNENYI